MSNSSSIQYINSTNLENISFEDARSSSQLSGEAINREQGNNKIQKQAKSSDVQNVNLHNGYLVGNSNPNADFGITNCNVGEPNNVHGNVQTHNIGPAYIFISNNGQMHSSQNNAAHVNSGFVQYSSENIAVYNNVVNSSLELSMQDVSSNTNNIVAPQNVIIVNSTPVSFIPIQSQVQSGAQVSRKSYIYCFHLQIVAFSSQINELRFRIYWNLNFKFKSKEINFLHI